MPFFTESTAALCKVYSDKFPLLQEKLRKDSLKCKLYCIFIIYFKLLDSFILWLRNIGDTFANLIV